MEYKQLGGSGLMVPALTFGTATFGGSTEFFKTWGSTDVAEATRMIDICLEAGVNMFDTADVYSRGDSESILGEAIKGRRDDVLISTKATFRFDDGANNVGSSRHHLIRTCRLLPVLPGLQMTLPYLSAPDLVQVNIFGIGVYQGHHIDALVYMIPIAPKFKKCFL